MPNKSKLVCGWCGGDVYIDEAFPSDDLSYMYKYVYCSDECDVSSVVHIHASAGNLDCPVCMEKEWKESSTYSEAEFREALALPVSCLGYNEQGCGGEWTIRYTRVEILEISREPERAREKKKPSVALVPDNPAIGTGPVNGWIYVARNSSLPGKFKVGMTERSVSQRLRELSPTGLPSAYEEAYSCSSDSPRVHEQEIHARLAEFRVTDDREFFECEISTIINTVIEVVRPQILTD